MTFVLIHGSFEHATDAWFPWLKKELLQMGHKVIVPQFPVDSWSEVSKISAASYNPTQNFASWLTKFEEIKSKIINTEKVCFIGHSLGPLFILRVVERYNLQVANVFFVAPFFEVYGKSDYIEKANASFYKTNFDFKNLRKLIPCSTVIYSDDDPYVDENKSIEFAQKLGSDIIKLHGVGHMGAEAKMVEFPQLLELLEKVV